MESGRKRNIVIIGGGVIGCTTAYFLTRHPKFDPFLHSITLLEASSIAAGASGRAGGLLALWAYPESLVPLSFRLHADLAAEHDGANRWGYRRVQCGSFAATVSASKLASFSNTQAGTDVGKGEDTNALGSAGAETKEWEKLPKQKYGVEVTGSPLPPDLDWIDAETVEGYSEMGHPSRTDTAQVHPLHFTTSIAALAKEQGVDFRIGARATKISSTKAGVESVEYVERESSELRVIQSVTDVVVSAGPWTGKLLPRSKVGGLRAHSVVYDAEVSPYAVFSDIELPADYVPEHRARMGQKRRHKGSVDPEIYARPFGEVYACGEPDSTVPLPDAADQVQIDEAQCDDLIAYIGTVSPVLRKAPIKAKQACYLPRHMRFGEERGPLIGPTSIPGLWVASGHTCWGVQNSAATGCLMAEYLMDGEARSANIEKLDPRKFKV